MATYKKLISLTFTHSYFTNSVLPDVHVVPLSKTAALLKNYKLMLRRDSVGYHLLYQALDSGDARIEADDDAMLSFGIFIDDMNLVNYTDLPAKSSSKDIYLTDNSSGAGTLTLTAIPVRPSVFTHVVEAAEASATLSVTDADDTEIINETFERSNGVYDMPVNLEGYSDGTYTFTFTPAGGAASAVDIYISTEVLRMRPFAVLNLVNSGSGGFNYSTTDIYTLALTTKSQQWVYHLLLGSDYTGYTITVKDKKVNDSDIESEYPAVGFKETTGETDFEEGTQLSFKSVDPDDDTTDANLPLYQIPNKDLIVELDRPGNGGPAVNKTITPLPNPLTTSLKPEIYINI